MAKTHRIFHEPRKGVVAHTALSKFIATTPLLRSYLGLLTEEIWLGSMRVIDAMEKWPESQGPNETSYNLVTDQYEAYFDSMNKDPPRARRFADVMMSLHAGGKYKRSGSITHYRWESVSEDIVVDLGGSEGYMCFDLARRYPKMRCISQDLPNVVTGVEIPRSIKDRIDITAHDKKVLLLSQFKMIHQSFERFLLAVKIEDRDNLEVWTKVRLLRNRSLTVPLFNPRNLKHYIITSKSCYCKLNRSGFRMGTIGKWGW